MDFKTFFIKKIMMSFFISVACICVAMAIIGVIFEADTRFGYEAFLSPLIFGAAATLPTLVQYSKKELSLSQTAVRKGIHLVLLEVVILSILYLEGMLTSISMALSLGISISVIDLAVNMVLWIKDRSIANEFNDALKKLQRDFGTAE